MKSTMRLQSKVQRSQILRPLRVLLMSGSRAKPSSSWPCWTPVLLMIVVGIVEMGRYASLSILVGNAARAGAQYGSENPANAADTAGITCAAENESLNGAASCPSSNPSGLAVAFPIGTPTASRM